MVIVVTLTTNFATRNKLSTKVETVWSRPISFFYVNDSLVSDSTMLVTVFNDKNGDALGMYDYYVSTKDTIISKTNTSFLLYDLDEREKYWKIGYYDTEKKKFAFQYLDEVYIAPSESETIAYYTKQRKFYKERSSKWIADFSLPPIKTIKCFYLPPSEYAAIPDSLIRKLPI